jgi:beta-carotene hydroxylase
MKPTAIKIDRKWIGAPDAAWNPTISLFVVVVAGYVLGVAGLIAGSVPVLLGVIWLAICLYIGFTVMHDAMHGTAHRSKKVGNTMGRICGLSLMVPLPLFHAVHHAHHGHTNDPERDPDILVAAGPAWLRPVMLLAVVPVYRWHFYHSKLWRNQESLREAIVTDIAILGFLVWAFASGFGSWVVVLWLAPAILAAMWLAFAFDYLPHHPHSEQGRYFDTRIYPGRIANILLLGQNYHLIHHLWTTIPWYRYQEVYASIEPELRERECAIGWTSRAVRPPSAIEPATLDLPATA